MKLLETRDKVELVIAALVIGIWFVGFELTTLGGDPTWASRLLVLASAFTIFGDNVLKARELISNGDGDGDSDES